MLTDGRPVDSAAVELRWSDHLTHKPVTVKTGADGRFRVDDAPQGQPVAIRVRAGKLVNAAIVYRAADLNRHSHDPGLGRECLPCSRAGNRWRGGTRLHEPRWLCPPRSRRSSRPLRANRTRRTKRSPSTTRPRWRRSSPTRMAGSRRVRCGRGATTRRSSRRRGWCRNPSARMRGQAGQVHEFRPLALSGTSSTVAGVVIGMDGQAGQWGNCRQFRGRAGTSGRCDRRQRGDSQCPGSYDGPVALVTHKPGYRRAYTIARTGETDARIVLRALAEPPATIPGLSDADKRAEAELIRRLTAIADPPIDQPVPGPRPDDWAEARKNLDAYLAKTAAAPGGTHTLLALAHELAKDDRAKSLKALRELRKRPNGR